MSRRFVFFQTFFCCLQVGFACQACLFELADVFHERLFPLNGGNSSSFFFLVSGGCWSGLVSASSSSNKSPSENCVSNSPMSWSSCSNSFKRSSPASTSSLTRTKYLVTFESYKHFLQMKNETHILTIMLNK